LHQWYWNYEYPDFLNNDGDFVEFDSYSVELDSIQLKSTLPSFNQLNASLDLPSPPTRNITYYPDNDLFERLEKQKNHNLYKPFNYDSPRWDSDRILDQTLKDRAVCLAEKSGNLGKDGYYIKEYTTGSKKGQRVVCLNNNSIIAARLLEIIKK